MSARGITETSPETDAIACANDLIAAYVLVQLGAQRAGARSRQSAP